MKKKHTLVVGGEIVEYGNLTSLLGRFGKIHVNKKKE